MEILIAVVDNGTELDGIKIGEVITIQPDGWAWTSAELTNPDWRIISAPILATSASTFMQEYISPQFRVSGMKYPRKKFLADLTAFPIPAKFQGARTGAIITLTRAQMLAVAKAVT